MRYPDYAPQSLSEAYAIQDEMIAKLGKPVLGWKVARLPAAMAADVGAPAIAGPIFAVSHAVDAQPVAAGVYVGGYAAGEAEYLLRIGDPPQLGASGINVDEAAKSIAGVHVGIEINSSPVADIVACGAAAIAADFCINNGIIVGPEVPDWRAADIDGWPVSSAIDDVEVGRGSTGGIAGGLLGSFAILLGALAGLGHQLREGQWVATGAVTGVHPIEPQQTMLARFGGRHTVSFTATAVAASPISNI